MKHDLKISISREPPGGGIVRCRTVTLRERLLDRLLGARHRMEGYAIARQNGWMSANDIRELENMNPLTDDQGGNAYLVNGNMIPINLARKEEPTNGKQILELGTE